ncbi:AAA family ATPase [Idiomarina sp. Sol25]|uniref:AAA family ATPase n=1 Tax=Idiomarina sp. Sol25 TaxID=3064000 RepID=UPI00294B35F4|nr:AAA family ATPase [Idiomarina sp. Sol25]MDV6326860.1 AAA family ATPase [Idiomarina sp. Sol25]
MDKRVIFAVAGSGKTSLIIDKISQNSRCLILTYTENNFKNLKHRIFEKFGCIPSGVKVYTYFTFIYSFCFKPLLGHQVKIKGICWETPPHFTLRLKRSDGRFYIDKHKRLYHNRIAKLFEQREIIGEINERIEKYFDHICIDEVQDFGGHDFNFLTQIAKANVDQLLVGDFYQHTFDTSRDGNTNKALHTCYTKYKQRFIDAGFAIDSETLSHSYRCSSTVCNFVKGNIGIEVSSHREDATSVEFVDREDRAAELFNCNETVKLFYQASHKYPGFTSNWGATKGENHYNDVCVVLNATTMEKYSKDELNDLPSSTKNKLYVACTRANRHLFLIPERYLSAFKK